jgi:uncharacterized protein (TIGR03663 family)
MAVETFPQTPIRPVARLVDLSRINLEIVAYVVLMVLSVGAHLWSLDRMALHHDESIHAWTSWRFYTGAGSFSCWSGLSPEGQPLNTVTAPTYCYDPVYHGPTLYMATFLSYFLFGDGDAQARLPMAVAGILLVASCWWLRPLLGRNGAFIAAVLLGFSPSLLYYTRFARHDGLMLLFELWMVIGAFRWLESGRARWLYLTAAATALAIGTHELYYILFFIFGVFVLMRLVAESRFERYLNPALLALIAVCALLMIFNPPLPIGRGLYLGEKAFLVASALLLAWLCQRLWEPLPSLTHQLQDLWQQRRSELWIAIAILGAIYIVLYTTFFAYPRGAIDGLYAGLAYWLGSQQDYARGDQPWYYYLIQLPLYEPLGVLAGLGMLGFMISNVARNIFDARRAVSRTGARSRGTGAGGQEPGAGGQEPDAANSDEHAEPVVAELPEPRRVPLFALFLVFWYFVAIIIFSWAGEKMPWLVVHMALPGNLLVAWVLGRLLQNGMFSAEARRQHSEFKSTDVADDIAVAQPATQATLVRVWLVPLVTLLMFVALGVALWRFGITSEGQSGQSSLLQGMVPLLIAGGLLYALLTLAQQLGGRLVLSLIALTASLVVGGYMLRATWMVVYQHPDTPVELLIYTQTSPDVPRYVDDVRELAINLTRNSRTAEDPAGGLSMPIILDSGNESGEGSLAWPLQWYLRDFQRLNWKRSSDMQANPSSAFEVQLPDGSTGLAPVVMLYKPHVNDELRTALEENYVQPYGPTGVFNWWFPEGDKCSPQNAGYKRFYFNTLTPPAILSGEESQGCGRDISQEVQSPLAPIVEPFRRENWGWVWNFYLFRELPYPLTPGAREMEVWMRSDLTGGIASTTGGPSQATSLKLVAEQAFSTPDISGPTGLASDSDGNVYIADTGQHRILVFNPQGDLLSSFGSFGSGLGQLYEPRGIAIDDAGFIYVADTWNARVVKYSPEGEPLKAWGSGEEELGDGRRATITDGTQAGNEAEPLGFFGPRGIAVDTRGNVYIADTGNKRIVVTDNEGTYLYQFGYAGADLGAFNEPTGVAVDGQGNLYVADTWNGRVQVFAPGEGGRIGPVPIVSWRVSGWRANTYDDPSIAASPDGKIYVSVPAQNAVLAANLRGDILLRWGGTGDDLASLNSPSGIAVGPDGTVTVADRASNRALRFAIPNVQE